MAEAGRYARELAGLGRTLAWVATSDLGPLRHAIRDATRSSLRAVGSGGSLTAAHLLATLHKRYSGHLAAAATPLEAISEPLDPAVLHVAPNGWRVQHRHTLRRQVVDP